MATVAVCASVPGSTGQERLKLAPNANGEPSTGEPSIETATLLGVG